jgi:D-alanyl-D-alanine carboxypeptidase/D-alanyl-D-alanine-endopeptidase (penicillin-binding protein 4)
MFLKGLLLILFSILNPEDLSILIKQNVNLTFYERIEIISERLLNTPYKESSIGEGQGVDADPPVNLTYVDCVSFIEYVIAFANSLSIEEFERHIRFMRYGDREISFENRMHLPDNQWFPNMLKYGYITDITTEVGGSLAKDIKKSVNNGYFYISGVKIPSDRLIMRMVTIKYIPVSDVLKVVNKIPEFSIIRILREDSFRPYATTHLGIVVKKKNGLYFRHSSRHFGGKVVDTPLVTYFSTFEKYENWKVLGIGVYRINAIRKKDAE